MRKIFNGINPDVFKPLAPGLKKQVQNLRVRGAELRNAKDFSGAGAVDRTAQKWEEVVAKVSR